MPSPKSKMTENDKRKLPDAPDPDQQALPAGSTAMPIHKSTPPASKRPKINDHSSSPSSSTTGSSAGTLDSHIEHDTHLRTGSQESKSLAITLLPRVPLWTFDAYNGDLAPVPAVNINAAFDKSTIARLRVIELMPNFSDSVALALANPDVLRLNGGYITYQDCRKPAVFSVIGSCRYSLLFSGNNGRQLCINVSDKTLPRAVAVLGAVLGESQLYAASYKGGLSFSTLKKGNRSSTSSPSKARGVVDPTPRRNGQGPPFRAVLPWDEDIPAYNGTESFNSNAYNRLKHLNFEIQPDAAVMVMFTIGTFPYAYVANTIPTDGLNRSLSLNIQTVILLANPSHDKDIEDRKADDPIGIDPESTMDSVDDCAGNGGEDPGIVV